MECLVLSLWLVAAMALISLSVACLGIMIEIQDLLDQRSHRARLEKIRKLVDSDH